MTVAFPETTDPVAPVLANQILEGIKAVEEANKILLASAEVGAGLREIDKELKSYLPSDKNDVSEKNQDVVKAVVRLEKARIAFKKAQLDARNSYRKNVLGEDEENNENDESEVDEDAVKARRNMVMKAVGLLKSYGETNNLTEVVKWAETVSVPQVGRQGSSTVGQRKPRAYVTVGEKTHDSFGEAAKALTAILSTDTNKVEVTSNDLVSAWDEAGTDTFEFQGNSIRVAEKEKKAKVAA